MEATFTREWTEDRREQGFTPESFARFMAYMDHRDCCEECKRPGPGVLLDDGYQPTQNECVEAARLYALYSRSR